MIPHKAPGMHVFMCFTFLVHKTTPFSHPVYNAQMVSIVKFQPKVNNNLIK